MEEKIVNIEKFNGDIEPFKVEKLKTSLRRSMATEEEIETIVSHIMPTLYNGITSKEIYNRAFSLLKKYNRTSASKYSLKRAIFDLGPTGYPFERLISALLRHKGFETKVGVVLQGECVSHEEIGRASCRHRLEIAGGADQLDKLHDGYARATGKTHGE